MNRKPKLTPAEWEIMQAVWGLEGSTTVREVLDRAFPAGEKAYTTVQTVMNTLLKKGLLQRRKRGAINFYAPTRSRAEVTRAEMDSLLGRVFGGSIPALASSLMSLEDLSLDEIAQIRALLRVKERQLKGDGDD